MSKAYTLIELIIVIGVMALLAGLSSVSLVSFGKSADVATSAQIIASALREAQTNSISSLSDKPWGVYFETNKVTVFVDNGAGFTPSDGTNSIRPLTTNTGETWQLGGQSLLIFAKRTGKPNVTGQITVSGKSQNSVILSVNSEGRISK